MSSSSFTLRSRALEVAISKATKERCIHVLGMSRPGSQWLVCQYPTTEKMEETTVRYVLPLGEVTRICHQNSHLKL